MLLSICREKCENDEKNYNHTTEFSALSEQKIIKQIARDRSILAGFINIDHLRHSNNSQHHITTFKRSTGARGNFFFYLIRKNTGPLGAMLGPLRKFRNQLAAEGINEEGLVITK